MWYCPVMNQQGNSSMKGGYYSSKTGASSSRTMCISGYPVGLGGWGFQTKQKHKAAQTSFSCTESHRRLNVALAEKPNQRLPANQPQSRGADKQ